MPEDAPRPRDGGKPALFLHDMRIHLQSERISACIRFAK
jgi:hypothetical protein